jgi:hypothetical protein
VSRPATFRVGAKTRRKSADCVPFEIIPAYLSHSSGSFTNPMCVTLIPEAL